MTVLVTGGAGFFGAILKARLLDLREKVVSVDLVPDAAAHPNLLAIQGDIRDEKLMARLFETHRFEAVYHCAAILAHAAEDEAFLWTSNVDGTRLVAALAQKAGCRAFVFISSNCLWAQSFDAPVGEETPPAPVEIYGRSKLAGEEILLAEKGDMNIVLLRCPTILEEGRLGLLTFLFDFIRENKIVWVVGGGSNRYQFIAAQDLVDACLLAAQKTKGCRLYHVGADAVIPFKTMYENIIRRAGSRSRVRGLPRFPTLPLMRLAHALRLSPLGPYHYKMIASDFIFDTARAKKELGWQPALTGEEILWRAYRYYDENYAEIVARKNVSAHRQRAKMGIIRLLKWIS